MALAVLALPVPAASAATLTIVDGAATYAAGAEPNLRVQVRYDGAAGTLAVTDLASTPCPVPAGCTPHGERDRRDPPPPAPPRACAPSSSAHRGWCHSVTAGGTAAPPFGLQVALGPGDDRLDMQAGVALAVRGEGGNGRDGLTGGDGAGSADGRRRPPPTSSTGRPPADGGGAARARHGPEPR